MRLLIYILAMLTGFSAAEAARPVSAVPASVGAEVERAHAAAAVNTLVQAHPLPLAEAPVSALPSAGDFGVAAFLAVALTTPIARYDVILG
jgi:hypothetical protein